MAKSSEKSSPLAMLSSQYPENDRWKDDAAFLLDLTQKQGVALKLTAELAAWFGDHPYNQPMRFYA